MKPNGTPPQSQPPPPPTPLTSERIKCYQRSIDALPSSTLRPTEGQLRYQQFYSKQKAKAVKETVKVRLYRGSKFEEDISAIPGVTEEDVEFVQDFVLRKEKSCDLPSKNKNGDLNNLSEEEEEEEEDEEEMGDRGYDVNHYQNLILDKDDSITSIVYKVYLAVSARMYVERKKKQQHVQDMDRTNGSKYTIQLLESEQVERERVQRFLEAKEDAASFHQQFQSKSASNNAQLKQKTQPSATNRNQSFKKFANVIDGRSYHDLQRAPIHTYSKERSRLFAKEHVKNDYDPVSHYAGNYFYPDTAPASGQEQELVTALPIVRNVDRVLKEIQRSSAKKSSSNTSNARFQASTSNYSHTYSHSRATSTKEEEERIQRRKQTEAMLVSSSSSAIESALALEPEPEYSVSHHRNNNSVSDAARKLQFNDDIDDDPTDTAMPSSSDHHPSFDDKIIPSSSDNTDLLSAQVMEKLILKSPGAHPGLSSEASSDPSTSDNALTAAAANVSSSISPTRLSQKHHEIMYAIKIHNWDTVRKSLEHNEYLAEMSDALTGQLLLHQIALHGSNAPVLLIDLIYDTYPSGVHKFDVDGNLPLHFACSAGNIHLVSLLLTHFEGGTSVRNIDGLLPLHFAAISGNIDVTRMLLNAFLEGVGVCDNAGNLPLHFAASLAEGIGGEEIIKALIQEDVGVRLENIKRNRSIMSTTHAHHFQNENHHDNDQKSNDGEDGYGEEHRTIPSLMVRNKDNNTPLMVAVRACSGWRAIEALVKCPNGEAVALERDVNGSIPLHYLVCGKYANPSSALALMRQVPQCVLQPRDDERLVIEIAIEGRMPHEIIFAITLLDLPFDLDADVRLKSGYGATWEFIATRCDDAYVDVIERIISMCNHHQLRELCFFRGYYEPEVGDDKEDEKENIRSVISRATPKVHEALRRSLRFMGRYEFVSGEALFVDTSLGLKIFDAADFGSKEDPLPESRRVILRCYRDEHRCYDDTLHIRFNRLDYTYVEKTEYFRVEDDSLQSQSSKDNATSKFCVAVERPNLTLSRITQSLSESEKGNKRIILKLSAVLRAIAKCIRYLHSQNIVHADINMETCGKFGDQWKLMNTTGMSSNGQALPRSRFGTSLPPETVYLDFQNKKVRIKDTIIATPTMDIWAFGKLMCESLLGVPLLDFDGTNQPEYDHTGLHALASWDSRRIDFVTELLVENGVEASGADLIAYCLSPLPHQRPRSMDEILYHPYWNLLKQKSLISSMIPSRMVRSRSTSSTHSFSSRIVHRNKLSSRSEETGEI